MAALLRLMGRQRVGLGIIPYFILGYRSARSAFSGCCSQSEPVFPVSNLPAQHKAAKPNRHYLCHAEPLHTTPKCYFFRAGGFPKVPATVPPMCILFADAFQRLLTAHRKAGLCVVVLPAIDAFQHPSSQRLLRYCPPSSFYLFPVCWQLQRAHYLDFARVRAPRSATSGCVQRTGCSACGLGYPHQVWWAPPMYIARAWAR
jgi:hypothetical protein